MCLSQEPTTTTTLLQNQFAGILSGLQFVAEIFLYYTGEFGVLTFYDAQGFRV